MASPINKELLLQNNLAMAATLLYRAVCCLENPKDPHNEQDTFDIIYEANEWFRNTRKAITKALEAPEAATVTVSTAQPAVPSGTRWISDLPVMAQLTEDSITASIALADSTAHVTSQEGKSPTLSSGGNSSNIGDSSKKLDGLSYFLNF